MQTRMGKFFVLYKRFLNFYENLFLSFNIETETIGTEAPIFYSLELRKNVIQL
jgi:hypothetical protein